MVVKEWMSTKQEETKKIQSLGGGLDLYTSLLGKKDILGFGFRFLFKEQP